MSSKVLVGDAYVQAQELFRNGPNPENCIGGMDGEIRRLYSLAETMDCGLAMVRANKLETMRWADRKLAPLCGAWLVFDSTTGLWLVPRHYWSSIIRTHRQNVFEFN